MDTKRMLVGMLVITGVMILWQLMYALHPNWQRPGEDASSTQPATTQSVASGEISTTQVASGTASTAPTTQVSGWQIAATQPGSAPLLGSAGFQDKSARMGVQLSSRGAGIDWVALNQFRQAVDSDEIFKFQKPYDAIKGNTASLATTAVIIDGTRVDLSDAQWATYGQASASQCTLFTDVANGSTSLRLLKTFTLPDAANDPAQGYELHVNYAVQNRSSAPHAVVIECNGPTVPHAETSRQDTEVVAGYDDDGYLKLENKDVTSFKDASEQDFSVNTKKQPLLWVGASSNYFDAIVRPENKQFSKATVRALNPGDTANPRLVNITLTSAPMTIQPGAAGNLDLHAFFGPKTRQLLNSKYYASFPLNYDQTLILISGGFFNICAFCTWSWLINVLVVLLAGFHFLLRDWGLAIIALVCCVRLLLHPITKRSQVSMVKMQKLAPEIERLKQKYGDDKDGFARAQMDVYKSVGFTPVLGCLPMFLQMPIFIALWRALLTTFELRQAPFLEFFNTHLTWIHDLSQPDQLIKFGTTYSFLFISISAINILPIAMAIVTFINQKYFMPRPAAMTPEQEQQQKMMTWMTLIFPFMFYSFPSGLNLYYLTSTSLGIIESKRIRDHIKQKQEIEEREGPIRVDVAKRSRTARNDMNPAAPAPQGRIAGMIAKLQARAEQAIIEAEKKRKDDKK